MTICPHVALGRKGLAESGPMSSIITLVHGSVTRLSSLFMFQNKSLGLETEDAFEQGVIVGSASGDFVPRLGFMFAPQQYLLGYSMFYAISACIPHSWLRCNWRKRKSRACMHDDRWRARISSPVRRCAGDLKSRKTASFGPIKSDASKGFHIWIHEGALL